MSERVAVTGWGAVCAPGATVAQSMDALYAGRVPPAEPERLATTLRERPRAFFVPAGLGRELDAAERPLRTRSAELALVALGEARAMAWPRGLGFEPARVGVCMGTTVGCAFNDEDFYRRYRQDRVALLEPVARYTDGDLSGTLAVAIGAQGPALTVANACSSGTDAIGLGASWLRAGLCDLVVAGGADRLSRFPYLGFYALRNSSTRDCRPFDRDRDGLNLGEGAGVLVLEREPDARRRGAEVLGLVAGYGCAADAHHATAPHPEGRGLRLAIAHALADAGLESRAVGLVNAHGTGTVHNDRVEGQALVDCLSPEVTVVATKGYTGHTLGAAGAIEAIFALCNLRDGRVGPSAGFATPDPACAVVPTREPAATPARVALSTSLAFGGTNSVLVLLAGDAR
ncbi:MAG: beta-ketoacyl-[acyl-carrier-protein] synthase family protein [Deltaproteobacteria bacterium]|nr:beta-ketoacyl-[acyl-carrier-protein] synthase family protein [Deltaproteobacteria bacterium]